MSEVVHPGDGGGYRLDELGWLQFERLARELLARDPAWAPGIGGSRLAARIRTAAHEARLALASAVVITNEPDGDETAWRDALAVVPETGRRARPPATRQPFPPVIASSRPRLLEHGGATRLPPAPP